MSNSEDDQPGSDLTCFRCGEQATFMVPDGYLCPAHALVEAAVKPFIPVAIRRRTRRLREAYGGK